MLDVLIVHLRSFSIHFFATYVRFSRRVYGALPIITERFTNLYKSISIIINAHKIKSNIYFHAKKLIPVRGKEITDQID